ncbi:MAG TPA: hypothetical protein VGR67_01770 [Candidatus Polarisedimenticolia bacterium]|jgi:transposase|nr:hypothetical protein [Candidatus Polarisedimenticolia bacterium]
MGTPSPARTEPETLRIIEVIQAAARPESLAIPKAISARTLADRLDISLSWVRGWHAAGLLPGIVLRAESGRGRGRLLFLEADVVRFLQERGIAAQSEEVAE